MRANNDSLGGGLTNNFWVQIGLVILTVVVIALAAKYIW
jgi:hypothetical protein